MEKIPDADIRCDFERVVDELGYVPGTFEYTKYGEYSASLIGSRFSESGSSYVDGVRTLGHEPPNTKAGEVPSQVLKDDFNRLVSDLGRTPSREEHVEQSEHRTKTFSARFDPEGGASYYRAVEFLGYPFPSTA